MSTVPHKEIPQELMELHQSLKDFETHFDATLERMQSKMLGILETFKIVQKRLRETEDLKNKENSKINASLCNNSSFMEEPTQFVTPDRSVNVRYPKYISPSLKNSQNVSNSMGNTSVTFAAKNKIIEPVTSDLQQLKHVQIIQGFSRGMLSRLVYGSKSVCSLRDTVKESRKILESMEAEKKNLKKNFNEKDFKDRFLIEINMAKEKIYSIFFEYSSSQRFSLARQSTKHKTTPVAETKMSKISKKTPESSHSSHVNSRKNVSPTMPSNVSRRK